MVRLQVFPFVIACILFTSTLKVLLQVYCVYATIRNILPPYGKFFFYFYWFIPLALQPKSRFFRYSPFTVTMSLLFVPGRAFPCHACRALRAFVLWSPKWLHVFVFYVLRYLCVLRTYMLTCLCIIRAYVCMPLHLRTFVPPYRVFCTLQGQKMF